MSDSSRDTDPILKHIAALHATMEAHRNETAEQMASANGIAASTLKAMVQMQTLISGLADSLVETREKRYEEEIDNLEKQISVLQHRVEEKQAARTAVVDTGTRMRETATQVARELQQQEKEAEAARRVDWQRWFIDKVLPWIAGAALIGAAANWNELMRLLLGD